MPVPAARLPSRRSILTAVSAAALVATSGLLFAGPLNPPAGPVTSTYKTLTEVEPRIAINATNTPGDADSMFRITSPGSYYLTAQVSATPGKMGIEIAANGVTIDLNGYRVAGFPGSLDAIRSVGNLSDLTIKNGSVGPVGGSGIVLGGSGDLAHACRIERVSVVDCGSDGIVVQQDTIVSRCVVTGCAGDGIYVGTTARITECVVSECSNGILLSNDGTVEHCDVQSCDNDGIVIVARGRAAWNTCGRNGTQTATGSGIHVFGSGFHGALLEHNHCSQNDRGIWVEGTGTLIIANTCFANDYIIAPNNSYGPVINRVNPLTAGMNGVSAPSTLSTTDPNANFAY